MLLCPPICALAHTSACQGVPNLGRYRLWEHKSGALCHSKNPQQPRVTRSSSLAGAWSSAWARSETPNLEGGKGCSPKTFWRAGHWPRWEHVRLSYFEGSGAKTRDLQLRAWGDASWKTLHRLRSCRASRLSRIRHLGLCSFSLWGLSGHPSALIILMCRPADGRVGQWFGALSRLVVSKARLLAASQTGCC